MFSCKAFCSFLTSGLDGVGGQLHGSAVLPPETRAGTYFKGSSVHPTALLDGLEKRKSVPFIGVRTPNLPRYTYCKNLVL